ncbi:MAG TPA: alcohol dehydrogenase catalytic domain-containing protein [Acidimicrobiia bacterium]|nr:alcohol dehydrogenase catalytic domain-containing protein [Acidimicrobiia bacterium]
MKVAVVTGPGVVELRDEPEPRVGPDEVLVQVGACGLCTMERRLFLGEKQVYPVAPGHEVAGRIVETGSAVRDLAGSPQVGAVVTVDLLTRCGTCSACRRGRTALCKQPQGGALSDGTISMGAGLAEFVRAPARQAYPTGDAPIEHTSMGEPLACVVHSVRLSGFRAGDRVAVIGAGFMGRLHLALCRSLGAAEVGVVDVSAERLTEARAAGASWTASPDEAGHRGACDIVFVTAGAPGALELALELADDASTIVLYGAFPKSLQVPIGPDDIHHHEHAIVGVYSQEPEDWIAAAGYIRSGTIAADLDVLVTAAFDLADVAKAFELATTTPVYRVLVGS